LGPKQPEYFRYLRKLFEENPGGFYDPVTNPDGILILTIAENNLSLDNLTKKLAEGGAKKMPNQLYNYGNNFAFRGSLARFFERSFFHGRKLSPSNIVVGNGAGSILNMLAYSLCNPGEGVIIPAPYYPGFDLELGALSEAVTIPAYFKSSNNFEIDIDVLQEALDGAKAKNITVKALLISSPNNPMGVIYSREQLIKLYNWTKQHGIHFIVDEIYALSCYSEYTQRKEKVEFVSISSVLEELGEPFGDLVHVAWSFSKDFTLSGFRVGVMYSENKELIAAVNNQVFFYLASNFAQFVLNEMIDDEAFVDDFVKVNQQHLGNAYKTVTSCLTRHGVPFIEGGAGFFVLINLSKYLRSNDWEAEDELWRFLATECKVIFTPGSSMHCLEPGWFRCCFSTYAAEVVEKGLTRMVKLLDSRSTNK